MFDIKIEISNILLYPLTKVSINIFPLGRSSFINFVEMFTIAKSTIKHLFKSAEQKREEKIQCEIQHILKKIQDAKVASDVETMHLVTFIQTKQMFKLIKKEEKETAVRERTIVDPNAEQKKIFEIYKDEQKQITWEMHRNGKYYKKTDSNCMYCVHDISDADCICFTLTSRFTSEQVYESAIVVKNFLKRQVKIRKSKIKLSVPVPNDISNMINSYL